MFKSKWQKRYEAAEKNIEHWRDFYRKQAETCKDCQWLYEQNTYQAMALNDTLRDMQRIKES